jgi:hypothetical protein
MNVTATFEVPARFLAGLADGSIEFSAGILQDATSKRVLTWIRPVLDSISSLEQSPLGSLLRAAHAAQPWLQVADLALNVTTFVALQQQLSRIERAVDGVRDRITALEAKQDLALSVTFADKTSQIPVVARSVREIIADGKLELLKDQRDKLHGLSQYFTGAIQAVADADIPRRERIPLAIALLDYARVTGRADDLLCGVLRGPDEFVLQTDATAARLEKAAGAIGALLIDPQSNFARLSEIPAYDLRTAAERLGDFRRGLAAETDLAHQFPQLVCDATSVRKMIAPERRMLLVPHATAGAIKPELHKYSEGPAATTG